MEKLLTEKEWKDFVDSHKVDSQLDKATLAYWLYTLQQEQVDWDHDLLDECNYGDLVTGWALAKGMPTEQAFNFVTFARYTAHLA